MLDLRKRIEEIRETISKRERGLELGLVKKFYETLLVFASIPEDSIERDEFEEKILKVYRDLDSLGGLRYHKTFNKEVVWIRILTRLYYQSLPAEVKKKIKDSSPLAGKIILTIGQLDCRPSHLNSFCWSKIKDEMKNTEFPKENDVFHST